MIDSHPNSTYLALLPASGPIRATVSLPGSKSYTNRALVSAALAAGETTLVSPAECEDTSLLVAALEKLGVHVERHPDRWQVSGRNGQLEPYMGELDMGLAGSSLRFVLPLCAVTPGTDVVVTGNERMRERPIGPLVDALRELGAQVQYLERLGCPPVRVRGCEPGSGRVVHVGTTISSQFVSALLLAAPLMRGLEVVADGRLSSPSYVAMTRECMGEFGVAVESRAHSWAVPSDACYRGHEYRVEGDASAASYFWGLAALSRGTVGVTNLRADSAQGDAQFCRLLERMGCAVVDRTDLGEGIVVSGPALLQAIEADMTSMPDTAQSLAVIAAAAVGTTRITGLHTLAHKETDRLAALQAELKRVRVDSRIDADSIEVVGGEPVGGDVRTYGDHRMAMAFAMLSAQGAAMRIEEPDVVRKSFPGFWEQLQQVGIESHAG